MERIVKLFGELFKTNQSHTENYPDTSPDEDLDLVLDKHLKTNVEKKKRRRIARKRSPFFSEARPTRQRQFNDWYEIKYPDHTYTPDVDNRMYVRFLEFLLIMIKKDDFFGRFYTNETYRLYREYLEKAKVVGIRKPLDIHKPLKQKHRREIQDSRI